MKHLKVTFLWCSCLLMSFPVWASGGVLDTTFHSPDGYVLWDGGSGYDRGRDIALQQDGKILVTGYMTNGTDNDLMVIRYDKDGTLDAGFGTNGAYIYDGGNGNDGGYAIAVQSDNNILVAGDSLNGSDGDVIVLRLDTDGNLDPNFGSNGIFTYDSGNGYDSVIDLLVQSDGKIIMCGSNSNGTDSDLMVMRLTTNGILDTTFNTNGMAIYDGGNGYDSGLRLTIQNDGKILVTGSSHNGSDHDILVARFNADGTLDTAFGTNGTVLYNGGDYDRGYGIDVDSQGNILATGHVTQANAKETDYDIPVIRFDPNGVLDTDFGDNGIELFDGGTHEECYDLIVQNDDTILIAGHSGITASGISDWSLVVLKYAQNGTLDTTFGTNGVYQYNPTDNTEWGYGLALQTDGKIVVTGQAHNGTDDDVIVLRLTNSAGDSNEPNEPTGPSDPNTTIDPNSVSDPNQPADPNQAVDPNQTSDPNSPVDPNQVTDPNQIADPNQVTDPNQTTDSNQVTDPNEPVDPNEPGIEPGYLQWSQPLLLIDYDPDSNGLQSFCGGFAPSKTVVSETGRRTWQIVADDFPCLGPMPITRIRWWGSYKAWAQTEPPELQPDAWRISFWTHEPDESEEPPFVQVLVHEFEISADRIERALVGLNTLPANGPETLFKYDVALEPHEWFHPFEIPSKHNVFWISIVAMYPEGISRQNHWGWSTRPEPWREPAQNFVLYDDGPTPAVTLWPGILYPITSNAICAQEQGLDMAFELLTESPWICWDQPFMAVDDWPWARDETSMAVIPHAHDPIIEREVADDWLCERPGPITAVSWYGSYLSYVNEACACDKVPDPRRPDFFILSIFENADPDQEMPYDHPGAKIWEFWTHEFEEVLIGSEWQPEEEPNEAVFRYTARLPEPDWFICDGTVRTLWFSVVAVYEEPLDAIPYTWGWANSLHMFGSTALSVSFANEGLIPEPLYDQTGALVDMSFTLFTVPE